MTHTIKTKYVKIRRTIEMEIEVPADETMEQTNDWADNYLIPDCLNTETNIKHWFVDTTFVYDE